LPSEVFNRQADNWRILKRIAKVAGGNWPGYIDDAARAAAETRGDEELLVQLLADIRDTAFPEDNGTTIRSADLVQHLLELEQRPWAEMGKDGKALTQNKLARLLKPLAIGPERIGPEDGRVRGYKRQAFQEAFTRYLSEKGDDGGLQPSIRPERDEIGISDISEPSRPEPGWTDAKREKPNNDGLLDGWTVAKGGNGAMAQEAPPNTPWPGLTPKAVSALASEFASWAVPETGIRDRLAQYGAAGAVLEADIAKVLRCMGDEARRADDH
jgi:hypothetical protein